MTDKDKCRELCNKDESIKIFSKDWWMDAVCGNDNWDVLIVEKNNEIIAALTYCLEKKFIFNYIVQPVLTPINGIWIKYPPNIRESKKLVFEKEVMSDIADKIDSLNIDMFSQNFNYVTNWLPFYWKKYEQTTRYTYVIENTKSIENIFSDFSRLVRNNIKKSESAVRVYESDDIKKFYNINMMTFDRKNMKIPYTFDIVKRIDDACVSKKSRKIFIIEDKNSNIHCASYLVWDYANVYILMLGNNPEFRNSGSTTLLFWEGIKFANKNGKNFDFEVSMIA